MSKLRVRFAPSPTGNVHIGNIRVAIFNWLFARNQNGEFLLRVEDTDRERSTESAVEALLDVMDWLGLDHDGEILYQSSRLDDHRAAAESLVNSGCAIRKHSKDFGGQPVIFLLPYECSKIPFVRTKGEAGLAAAPGKEISITRSGAKFSCIENGKEIEKSCSLAGLYRLRILGRDGETLFDLDKRIASMSPADEIKISGAQRIEYVSREVFYHDHVKGELAKPLDSMKDFVIVRSDGSPVFHLANVCDDIAQDINFIVRGDDHVENTFRHVFLFHALGHQPPRYAHLPMIVNQAGKPYSKRDGDAYVGDFRKKGFLPQALFNHLALLGWSPGDDREKMGRDEMAGAFSLERVKSSPGKFDIQKLISMNGLYIAEMPPDAFAKLAIEFTSEWPEGKPSPDEFAKIAALMQSRTKTLAQAAEWKYFFHAPHEINPKDLEKALSRPGSRDALLSFAGSLATLDVSDKAIIEAQIRASEGSSGLQKGGLNPALRLLLTGAKSGPPIEDIIHILGAEKSAERIKPRRPVAATKKNDHRAAEFLNKYS